MTEIANPTLGKVEDLFEEIAWKGAIQLALNYCYTALPALRIPFIKFVVEFVVDKFATQLIKVLRLGIDLPAIFIINEGKQHEFDKAAVHLRLVERDYGLNSERYKKERRDAKEALSGLVHYRGA